jgi:beta-1,2-mannobiose phosphorylase / 1,2-beta-oligomannan phosphorylase
MKNATISVIAFVLLFLGSNRASAQFVWTKDSRNPILTGGVNGAWNKHLWAPFVLYNSDSSRYEMWFAGSVGVTTGPARFGYAISSDGINWSVHPTPVLAPTPGSWDQGNLEQPQVIRENGEYKMWYVGYTSSNGPFYIGHAKSADGINWTKYSGNPVLGPGTSVWEGGGAYVCSVMPGAKGYKMWYTGFNAVTSRASIGYAISPDGITWSRDTVNNPVLLPGVPGAWDDKSVLAPIVRNIGGSYYMWYTGFRTPDFWKTAGVAVSPDGVRNWTRYSGNPVISPTAGAWDGTYTEVASIILRGDTLHMWYDGSLDPTETNCFRIGHATSPVVASGVAEGDLEGPKCFMLEQNYPNPFNPKTVVSSQLPVASNVKLVVYDMLGRQVAVLVDERRAAGSYRDVFDGSGLASGVYIYQLRAGSSVQSRTMLLLK